MATMAKTALTLFDLPAEIRNQIYYECLVEKAPIQLPYAYECRTFTPPAILSAHPLIYREAAPIFYGCNTFSSPSPAAARQFLEKLSEEEVAWLRCFRPIECAVPDMEVLRREVNKIVKGRSGLGSEAVEALVHGEWTRLKQVEDWILHEKAAGDWSIERKEEGWTGT